MKRGGQSLILAILFLLVAVGNNLSAETIVIATGEWPPYVSSDLPSYGIAALITEEAFSLEGIEVQWVFLPWMRAYETVRDGEYDATILWVDTPDREAYFYMGDIIIEGRAVFFHRADENIVWNDISDLADLRIGGLLSASYPWFNKARERGIDLKMELVQSDIQNFRKLLYGRIDLFSIDLLVGKYILEKGFSEEEQAMISYIDKPIELWEYRILLPRNRKTIKTDLVNRFGSGLKKLKDSGRYYEIIEQYR